MDYLNMTVNCSLEPLTSELLTETVTCYVNEAIWKEIVLMKIAVDIFCEIKS